MFKGIKDNWRKAEAALVLQNLFRELVRAGMFDSDPASLANKLVSEAWDAYPEQFDGRFGQRPNKLTVATIALAMAVDALPREGRLHPVLLAALATMLSGIEENGGLTPLTALDERLLSKAREVFSAEAEALGANSLTPELEGLMGMS